MQIELGEKFLDICKEIIAEDLTEDEWAGRASSDYFYEMPFCGGFEKEANAFIFGFYDANDDLYSFKLALSQIPEIVSGKIQSVEAMREE